MDDSLYILIPIWIIAFVIASSLHEFAHAFAAYKLGDDTAKNMGRLDLNPLVHISWSGLIIFMVLLISTGGQWAFGWAKPVPFDPSRLRNPKSGIGIIAAAGPLSNIIQGLILAAIVKIFEPSIVGNLGLSRFFFIFLLLNGVLAGFNLIPVPPLDGSKILFSLLPYRWMGFYENLERYSMILFLVIIITPLGDHAIRFFVRPILLLFFRVFDLPDLAM